MSEPQDWYGVLDVEPDADTEQIRAAWRQRVADLEPGDPEFKQANEAAEVLLDADRRAAFDAERADRDEVDASHDSGDSDDSDEPVFDEPVFDDAASEPEETEEPEEPSKDEEGAPAGAKPGTATLTILGVESGPRRRVPTGDRGTPGRLLTGVLSVLALVLVVVTVLAVFDGDRVRAADPEVGDTSGSLPDSAEVAAARDAATHAVVPILSYDYRHLDAARQRAGEYLTTSYGEQYRRLFDSAIVPNAPSTKTVVGVRVIRSAVVRSGPGRVDVLLFINQPTKNKKGSVEYHNQVTLEMVEHDGSWLVNCMVTMPGGECTGS